MADLPELVREHAHRLHELASQARDVEEHRYSEGAVTSIQLDGLARIFAAQMEKYVSAYAEMLAALEFALLNSGRVRRKVRDQMRAAIAKARGGQP